MSDPNDAAPDSGDRDATRYGPTPPADPAATRYSDPPGDPDPAATRYSDTPADLHGAYSPTAGDPTLPGRRFRVLRPHAKGGIGEVFVAHDEELHRDVALKEIQGRYADDPESRSRFLVEAEITGGLEHPGIVPVYGLGQYADGRPFYAMRLIRGDSLKQAIERFHRPEAKRLPAGERALELRRLLGRFVAVCEAIAYAHSRGVLHRDLKPGNVMLGKYGETLVIDWGLAKPVGGPAGQDGAAEEPLRPASAADSSPTQMGTAIGTPSFMSPEQAAGRLDQLGPASDVYSLGATLYCLLTGKPPFSGPEVLQKVQRGDFPRPRQVRRDIPRALEAVCLKAVALRPQDRYPTPRALAADVEKWLADEPTTAYREPWRVRLGRWVRRRQTLAAGLAAGLLVAIVAGLVGAWQLDRLRTEQRRDVESSLTEVVRLQGEARWAEARAVLEQAKTRLGAGGPADLKARLERMQGELELVQTLDAIRLKKATLVEHRFDFAGADRGYADAFRAAGMAEVGGDAAAAAAWAAGSGVRDAVVAALDDWAGCAQEHGHRDWLLEVLRRADPDPWRDRGGDQAVWKDAAALARLAEEEQAAKQSPQLLDSLGWRLTSLGGDAAPMLRAAQERSPGEFWINFDLGNALDKGKKPEEAVGYYRAALAVRPGTVAVYINLGIALHDQGRRKEAAAEFHTAIALDPKDALPHNNLGTLLADQDKGEEAAAEFRAAIALDPKYAPPHYNLGNVLHELGKREEAAAEFRTAITLDPKDAPAYSNLGLVLYDQGKWEEAAAEFRAAIALDPKLAPAYSNLGNVLYDQGKREEAAAEYRTAIALDPKDAQPHNGLGNVLRDQGKGEEAAAEYRTAITLDTKYAEPHNNLGNVLADQGKREEAAADYRTAIALDPKFGLPHYGLGIVLYEQGKGEAAAAEYRTAIALDPRYAMPHYNLGHVLDDQGKREEAAAEYRTAIALDPKLAEAHGNLGILLLEQAKFTEAKEELQRCLELFRAEDPQRKIILRSCSGASGCSTSIKNCPPSSKGTPSPPARPNRRASPRCVRSRNAMRPPPASTQTPLRRSPRWPTRCKRPALTTPPAFLFWPPPARAKTRTSWTTGNAPACVGRPSAGCATPWPSGASCWTAARPRRGPPCCRRLHNGRWIPTWPACATRPRWRSCPRRHARTGKSSGPTWTPC